LLVRTPASPTKLLTGVGDGICKSRPLTMKLLVDTKSQRVLYAEAGKEVVDFLFSLLAFPLGAVTKLLNTGAMVGAVGKIYSSVKKLDAGYYLCRRDARNALLEAPVLQLVAAPALSAASEGLFRCKGCSCSPSCYNYATKVSGTPCPVCKGKMTTAVQLVEPDQEPKSGGSKPVPVPVMTGGGSGSSRGYVRDMMTYTVMDGLSIDPVSNISAVTSIIALGVRDLSGLQARTVEIGHK
jgi:hypothetical protein